MVPGGQREWPRNLRKRLHDRLDERAIARPDHRLPPRNHRPSLTAAHGLSPRSVKHLLHIAGARRPHPRDELPRQRRDASVAAHVGVHRAHEEQVRYVVTADRVRHRTRLRWRDVALICTRWCRSRAGSRRDVRGVCAHPGSGPHMTRDLPASFRLAPTYLPRGTLLNGGGEARAHPVSTVTIWASDRTACRWGAKGQS
jgi:hypothetical protein